MSRTQAAGRRVWKRGKDGQRRPTVIKPGQVDWNQVRADIRRQGIELRGGGADEAPEVYKRLDEVLAYHADTVRVVHRLYPVGVAMAGDDVFDPYKD